MSNVIFIHFTMAYSIPYQREWFKQNTYLLLIICFVIWSCKMKIQALLYFSNVIKWTKVHENDQLMSIMSPMDPIYFCQVAISILSRTVTSVCCTKFPQIPPTKLSSFYHSSCPNGNCQSPCEHRIQASIFTFWRQCGNENPLCSKKRSLYADVVSQVM